MKFKLFVVLIVQFLFPYALLSQAPVFNIADSYQPHYFPFLVNKNSPLLLVDAAEEKVVSIAVNALSGDVADISGKGLSIKNLSAVHVQFTIFYV